MATLEATQKTIEQVVNVMDENDLRSVLRDQKANIRVDLDEVEEFRGQAIPGGCR